MVQEGSGSGTMGKSREESSPPAALGCGVCDPALARDTVPHRYLVAAEPGRESCKMQPLNSLPSDQGGPELQLPPTPAGAGRRGLGSRRKLNRRQEKGPPPSGSIPEPTHLQDSGSQPGGSRLPHLDHHGTETRLKGCLHIY